MGGGGRYFSTYRRGAFFRTRRELLLVLFISSMIFTSVAILVLVISRTMNDRKQRAVLATAPVVVEEKSLVTLIAPNEDIKVGTPMRDIQFRTVRWPLADFPDGAVIRQEDIATLYAKVDLPANQPVLRTQLVDARPVGGISDLIPHGYRAITIEVNASAGVEGWAQPGAHVDVVVTYQDPNDRKKKSQVVAENAIVLSYNGQMLTGASEMGEMRRTNSATVTLTTSSRNSLRIQTAQALGKISLILRNDGDGASTNTSVISTDDFADPAQQKEPVAPPPPPPAVIAVVEKPEEPVLGSAKYYDSDGKQREVKLLPNGWQREAAPSSTQSAIDKPPNIFY